MNTKVGRNDPCPCGSGKKYKRCHLPLDQQRKPVAEVRPATAEPEEVPEYFPPKFPAKPSAAFLRDLVDKIPEKKRAESKELLEQTLEIAEYMERQQEIEAAGEALEPHREEFNKLLADEKAYLSQVQRLFAEERFAPSRFTAGDVRRAFAQVGGPPNFSMREETAKKLHAAIVFIADEKRRPQLAMSTLKHIPHYVKAGRFMDAWIIHHSVQATLDFVEESNPFLYEMFCHGFEAWSAEKEAQKEKLLRDFGLDRARLQGMSMDEIKAWLQEQQANPANQARLEAFYNAHPEQRDQAIADLEELEHEYATLLEREDARALLLPQEEVEAWLPKMCDSWQAALESIPGLATSNPGDEDSQKAFKTAIYPMLVEMAQAMFPPERNAELIIKLEDFQRRVFAAGEKRMAACAMAAINSLKREAKPDERYFLICLCYTSLRRLLATMAKQVPAQAEMEI